MSSPENYSESNGGPNPEISSNPVSLQVGSFSVDDAIAMHLVDCDQCREAVNRGPAKLGERSNHCDAYWQLQLMRAKFEGEVNNIVAHTELGDEAPTGGDLEGLSKNTARWRGDRARGR